MINSKKRIIVITGTNRGLGKGISHYLAQSGLCDNYHIIMTGRNIQSVETAQTEILQSIKHKKERCSIESKELDISCSKSIQSFTYWLAQSHQRLDVLYNNAGFVNKILDDYSGSTKPDQENARKTFKINYFGTVDLTQRLLPYLSSDGKIIQMSSNLGLLSIQGEKGRAFLSNLDLTESDLKKAAKNYIKNSANNDTTLFCNMAYHTSKAFLNSYTRFIAPKILKADQSMYALSPGWVKTDMGGIHADETLEQSCPYLCDMVTKIPYGRNPLSFKFIEKMKLINY